MKDVGVQEFEVTISGSRLLMHNGQLSDPMSPFTKELKSVTSKKKKSDEDHVEVGRREFIGSLYWDEEQGPYIPGVMLEACIIGGAKKRKHGETFKSTVSVVDDIQPLQYDGPRDPDDLWADKRFVDRRGVKVQKARVVRTRPIFRDWSVSFTIALMPCDLNGEDVRQAIEDAGKYVGIGDFRPRFGRFILDSFEKKISGGRRRAA